MKKLLFIIFFSIIAVTSTFSQQRMQDVVYLKDGTIIRGTIIEQVPDVSIKIQTKDKSVFVYKMEDILKITKEPIKTNYEGYSETELRDEKSPALAFVLSFLLPGAGQYYNGDVVKGVLQTGLVITGWVVALTTYEEEESGEYYYSGLYYTIYSSEKTAGVYIGVGIAVGAWVWSMIDAPISASNINKRRRQQYYGHLFETEIGNGKNVFGFDVIPTKNGVKGNFSIHF